MLTLPDPNYWYCLCVWVCVVPLRPTLEHFTGTPDPPQPVVRTKRFSHLGPAWRRHTACPPTA